MISAPLRTAAAGSAGVLRYCSRRCRDAFAGDRPKQSQQERTEATYFEWLFSAAG